MINQADFYNILVYQQQMKRSGSPIDSNFFVRYLHLHTIFYVFQLAKAPLSMNMQFPQPGFQLFRPIPRHFIGEKDRYKLFKNILLSYRWELSVGVLLTVIYASLNLLISQIIKQFMQTMQASDSLRSSSEITQKFIFLQILRMVFGAHMKRIFQQLAIQIQSTISKRLVKKALHLDPVYRKRIPQTEIYQLENVDLKIIYTMFSLLYLGCQIPFTIGIAIIWLFGLNFSLGVIALYWFLVIFLVQRVLDDRMKHCNLTKLGLIDKRSKVNYQFMQKMIQARIIRSQKLLVQKNNDLFLQQCHDHMTFYRFSSLYDIAQLLLPIAVVVTSLIYDQKSTQPMTVEHLYLILSMLGICYRPMKEFRTFSIALSDGFHSLRRITDYLELPEQKQDLLHYQKIQQSPAELLIEKGSIGKIESRGLGFELQVTFNIKVKAGERLVILGRKGQGSTTFLKMLTGRLPLTHGNIQLRGKVGYLSQQAFILIDTLYKNLAFYDNGITRSQAHKICVQLGLYQELSASGELDEQIEPNRYNQNQLKMITLARVLCSKANIYILDNPFGGLTNASQIKVENILRNRQANGVLIVMTLKKTETMISRDLVIILNVAMTKEFGLFGDLSTNPRSYIDNFIKNKQPQEVEDDEQKTFRRVARQFQNKVRKALIHSALFQKESQIRQRSKKIKFLVTTVRDYSKNLLFDHQQKLKKQAEQKHEADVSAYFIKFLNSCRLSESIFILIIIIAVEVLHIFIHFYIGHQYQHRANSGIKSMKILMIYEVVLTLGLGGLIYLEGEVSSYLAVIAGNKLYKQSLQSLVHKELRWFGDQYSLRTADKFNHDYQEIFILTHGVLTLYKNGVILIATALFVGGSHYIVLFMTMGVAGLYFAIWSLVRKAQVCILKRYYDYKYEFVKVFNESIEGSNLINVFGVKKEVVIKAKDKYTNLASYKLAMNYVSHGQALLCDLAATVVTAIALQFGTSLDTNKKQVAALATSILLLLNLADVLKAILDAAIQVESFFRLNIMPFMEIAPVTTKSFIQRKSEMPKTFDIDIDSVMFKEKDENVFEIFPLKLYIPEGQLICIYEEDETLRNNLLYGLTRNLASISDQNQPERNIFIGGVPISKIPFENMVTLIGVVMHQNFFVSGTLQENLRWRCKNFDEQLAKKLSRQLGIGQDVKRFNELGLKANIQEPDQEFSEGLSKKLAVIRMIIHKARIVIIKDTPPFVGRWSICQLLNKYNPGCTLIKITNSLQVAYDVERIVLLDHLRVVEQGHPKKLVNDRLSKIGEMLRLCNEQTYIYRNRVSVNPRNFNKKEHFNKISLMMRQSKKKTV